MKLEIFAALCLVASVQSAKQQRCFSCRSRGALGDCRDPFYVTVNSTASVDSVKALPCASGWCKKFEVDPDRSGREGDKNYLIERGCLGGGPDDNRGRCFEVNSYHGSPPGTLCICKGDVCNASSRTSSFTVLLVMTSAMSMFTR